MNPHQQKSLLQDLFNDLSLPARGGEITSVDPRLTELYILLLQARTGGNLIWITRENADFSQIKVSLRGWRPLLPDPPPRVCAYLLPFEDPYINNSIEEARLEEKMQLLDLLQGNSPSLVVITTLSALNLPVESPSRIKGLFRTLNTGDRISRDELIRHFLDGNYRIKDFIRKKGDISYRGSVVDIFALGHPLPFRIEIEDDTVISLREFDPGSQRSTRRVPALKVFCNRYFLSGNPLEDDHASGGLSDLQYLPDIIPESRVVIADRGEIETEYERLKEMFTEFYRLKRVEQPDIPEFPLKGLSPGASRSLTTINTQVYSPENPRAALRALEPGISYSPDREIDFLQKRHRSGYRVMIFDSSTAYFQHLQERMPGISHVPRQLPRSLEHKKEKILLWSKGISAKSETEIPSPEPEREEILLDGAPRFTKGDILVHREHGIGRYAGVSRLDLEDHSGDFFRVEYRDGGKLYIPVHESDTLNLYTSASGGTPPLDRLGGKTWARKRKKARKNIREFARSLLALYARRQSLPGRSYPPQPDLEDPCISDFRYVLTRDQNRAIRSVLEDLEREYPMDRLVCGDVGFGKTEVAVQAALRVVSNSMQVALLTPTTILAYQHYQTFRKRFRTLPVTVRMISRLVPRKTREQTIGDLAEGKVDIVIGTHALLASGISFSNLGLYILDEEQRFGVFQKEKLKENREDIDVLTLTATPIPRTLSLSMAGISDISLITTPPLGRIAVKNYIDYFKPAVITSAVKREISRSGQVFVIYNNIDRIFHFSEQLKSWLGPVPVAVIHARMTPRQVEQTLLSFIRGKYPVLVSTTIIENGIDISNVNTLIVVGAERFGLTQLYQLRGRIGRSTRQAYAFFLLSDTRLTEKARLRLEGIREFSELGSGYQIARYDYSLRGAGSLLGNRQHGHIEALGFDYYHELLKESIREIQGREKPRRIPRLTVAFPTRLESVTDLNPGQRIRLYKKILEAADIDEVKQVRDELVDRFGSLSVELDKILFIGLVRLLALKINTPEVSIHLDHLSLTVDKEMDMNHPVLSPFITRQERDRLVLQFKNFYTFMEILM